MTYDVTACDVTITLQRNSDFLEITNIEKQVKLFYSFIGLGRQSANGMVWYGMVNGRQKNRRHHMGKEFLSHCFHFMAHGCSVKRSAHFQLFFSNF